MEINERIGNVQTKAATLHNLGNIYANKGEVDQAIALFNQSLEIFERIGDVQGIAIRINKLNKQCSILINEPIFYVYTIKILKICYIIRY